MEGSKKQNAWYGQAEMGRHENKKKRKGEEERTGGLEGEGRTAKPGKQTREQMVAMTKLAMGEPGGMQQDAES